MFLSGPRDSSRDHREMAISLQKENNTLPLGFLLLQMSNFSFLNDFKFTERWEE